MEEELTQRWGTLNPIEEEQHELLLPEEDVLSTKLRGSHCLFAFILTDKNANREAFKSTMAKVWNLAVHNLPFTSMNEHLGKKIGAAIGKVHTVEIDDRGCGWGSYLSIRVEVNVNKPLLRGKMINLGGKKCWTYFKYERLTNFCFKCGLLKHANGKCPSFNLVSQSKEQHEQWLRAASSFPQPVSGKMYGGSPMSPSNRPPRREPAEVAGDGKVVVEKSQSVAEVKSSSQNNTAFHQ
ncbi:uncharacterized protein LOC121242232 [Juglans microcarpa x Juglans regia]|uniref:uncharacterized protein LOC121242232 n=1 Tax=Juglans microcarpa x Juglans regia TaxID=2249226 RepID=UPI001B7DA389|nr:uncharacterized protein LOC121242232 [Juglans microcarpa x Juglans regia]